MTDIFAFSIWRLRGNIIRTAVCWVVWHNVHTLIWAVFTGQADWVCHIGVHRGGCLELYYCNMVEWSWWDSNLICKTNWFPSVLWRCWFGHVTCKKVKGPVYNVFGGTLNIAQSAILFDHISWSSRMVAVIWKCCGVYYFLNHSMVYVVNKWLDVKTMPVEH